MCNEIKYKKKNYFKFRCQLFLEEEPTGSFVLN